MLKRVQAAAARRETADSHSPRSRNNGAATPTRKKIGIHATHQANEPSDATLQTIRATQSPAISAETINARKDTSLEQKRRSTALREIIAAIISHRLRLAAVTLGHRPKRSRHISIVRCTRCSSSILRNIADQISSTPPLIAKYRQM